MTARRLPSPVHSAATRDFGEELVVVDTATSRAHALAGPAATVWRAAAAGTWPDLPDEQIEEVVASLDALGLLLRSRALSRRHLLQVGGAALVAAGITSIALPAAAATNSVPEFDLTPGTYTLIIPPKRTVNFTVSGGGGGGGSNATQLTDAGGAGGAGGSLGGTIANGNTTSVTLTIYVGAGGATEILLGSTVLIVAGGGGGGGGGSYTGAGTAGTAGGTTAPTGTRAIGAGAAGAGNAQNGGGGGGGGASPGTGGASANFTPGGGGGAGGNFSQSAGGVTVTITSTATQPVAQSAGGAGGATAGAPGGAGTSGYADFPSYVT